MLQEGPFAPGFARVHGFDTMASAPNPVSQGGAAEPGPQPELDPPGYAAPSVEESESEDVLDQILENYNVICHPELRLKFKHQ